MRIIVAAALNNAEKSLFIDSLESMGHDVKSFSWDFNDAYTTDWMVQGRKSMNDQLEKFVLGYEGVNPGVDLVFCYLSARTLEVGRIRKLKEKLPHVPFVNFSWDDTLKFNWLAPIVAEFDFCWTTDPNAVEKYKQVRANPIYMPGGANPNVYHRIDTEPYFQVSFVGMNYGNRAAILRKLIQAGIDVHAFGNGFGGKISQEEMPRIYCSSYINLGFSKILDTEFYNVKGRDFEVPMSGGFYLTEDHPELHQHYEVGKDIATYASAEDCVEKVLYYLGHEENRKRMAVSGWLQANMNHKIQDRFKQLFSIIKNESMFWTNPETKRHEHASSNRV